MRIRDASLVLAALLFAACSDDAKPAPAAPPASPAPGAASSGIPVMTEPEAEAHSHEGTHGGVILELGSHEGHMEIVRDAAAGTLHAYVSDAEMKPVASEAPVINLTKGGVQVPMTAAAGGPGTSDAWKATHEALKGSPLDGRIRVKIGERTFQAVLAEKEAPK